MSFDYELRADGERQDPESDANISAVEPLVPSQAASTLVEKRCQLNCPLATPAVLDEVVM